jgi:Ca-activated chloride channel family protein
MQGDRLDTVKATAIELVRQLRPQDIFSVVQFSDRAEVLAPASSHTERRAVETRIQLLQASGGTEIYQGLEAGLGEVRRYRSSNHVNHIILITDGRTYGDEANCLQLGEQASVLGIRISSLGIGSQWNDHFLDQLCSRTGGGSKYIAKAEEIREFLSEKISGLGRSFAENVAFYFDVTEGTELTYAFRLNPDTSPLEISNPLILGSVPRDASHNWLAEFTVKNIPPNTAEVILASGRISYDVPGSKTQAKFNQRLVLARPTSKKFDTDTPSATIVQAMARLTLYRMQERARQDLEKGNIKEATRRLQNLATHLLAQGQRDLARSVLSEVAHIQQHQTFSEEGDKQIKYGTRSLLLPPGTKEKKP